MRGNKPYQINDRLRVRPISLEDTECIVTWRNRAHIRNNFIFREKFTVEMHENWMNTKVASGQVEQFIIELHDAKELSTSRPIGSVYFRDVDYDTGEAEYGIFLGEEDVLGKGIGSQIAKWAVNFAKEELGLNCLILRVFADNIGAVKSYEKAGFTQTEYIKDFLQDEKGSRDLIMMKRDLRGDI